ncbi:MAG: sensor histidine kinase, partial [Thermoguttaceae bacterium]
YKIVLKTNDEMAELADAMNDMTEKFEAIRHDLDEQVAKRTQEAVRNERLASVGFLAAGVAHEINNPLASISMCAESLQRRLEPILKNVADSSDIVNSSSLDNNNGRHENTVPNEPKELEILNKYLKMIQNEAFRCKTITEKLLDFARTEKGAKEKANLSAIVQEMVELVAHLGNYKEKEVRLSMPDEVCVTVNPQEIKQVVLNLITNGLDSIQPGGYVRIKLSQDGKNAVLEVEDNGCGMEPSILQNVFEPFFTHGKNGRGTGLGLAITHRIVTNHGGRIEASSPGPGKGATFRVELPK